MFIYSGCIIGAGKKKFLVTFTKFLPTPNVPISPLFLVADYTLFLLYLISGDIGEHREP